MGKSLRVLVVEDSMGDTELLLGELRRGGYDATFERVETADAMTTALGRQTWDIVFCDYQMPHFNGAAALKLLREKGLDIPFIFVSGTIGEDAAVAAMKAGANDYIMKGNTKRLLPALERELRESKVRREGQRAQKQLRQIEERFRQMAENVNEVFFLTNADATSMIYVSPTYKSIWGRSCQSLYADPLSWLESVYPEDRTRVSHLLREGPERFQTEYRVVRPDGAVRWIWVRTFPIKDQKGALCRLAGIAEDITERKQAEAALRESEKGYRTLAEAAHDAIFLLDRQGYLRYANGFAARQFGRRPEEIIGKRNDELFPPPIVEIHLKKILETGEPLYSEEEVLFQNRKVWLSIRLVPLKNEADGVDAILGIARDITERKRAQETIQQMAFYDSLTDLPNRINLIDRLLNAIRTDDGAGKPMALMLIDLDHFKEINDTLGHRYGDVLLKEVGARLKRALFVSDIVARLGGDEFAIFLPRLAKFEDINLVVQKIQKALQPPFMIEGLPIAVEASIGIALYPEHGGDPDSLLRRADVAMYAAKKSGSGAAFYVPELDRYSPQRLALMAELRQAIEQDQLLLHYQPKVSLKERKVFGVEALVRWKHPQRGMIPPDQFIGSAERTGLIHPLTDWVLKTAIRQYGEWRRAGFKIAVSVNLSARNLFDPKLPETVAALLRTSDISPDRIQFEITESAIMKDPARAQETLVKLRKIGVRFSIDDFGIGYSSLSYLQKLPVDQIKVDKSFVIHMTQSQGDVKIVRSTVDLAHNLGLQVVAEGVETREVLDRLTEMGCDAAQGYFISRPLPGEELIRWMQESSWGLK